VRCGRSVWRASRFGEGSVLWSNWTGSWLGSSGEVCWVGLGFVGGMFYGGGWVCLVQQVVMRMVMGAFVVIGRLGHNRQKVCALRVTFMSL